MNFVYTDNLYTDHSSIDQDSGWVVLSRDEAVELAHALIAVARGYTRGEQASFSFDEGHLSGLSIGE